MDIIKDTAEDSIMFNFSSVDDDWPNETHLDPEELADIHE